MRMDGGHGPMASACSSQALALPHPRRESHDPMEVTCAVREPLSRGGPKYLPLLSGECGREGSSTKVGCARISASPKERGHLVPHEQRAETCRTVRPRRSAAR